MNVGSTCQNWVRYPGTVQSYTAIIQRLWQWQANMVKTVLFEISLEKLSPVWLLGFLVLMLCFWPLLTVSWPWICSSDDHEARSFLSFVVPQEMWLGCDHKFEWFCPFAASSLLNFLPDQSSFPELELAARDVSWIVQAGLQSIDGRGQRLPVTVTAKNHKCLYVFRPTYCRRRLGIEGKVLACHTATSTELPFSSKETSR